MNRRSFFQRCLGFGLGLLGVGSLPSRGEVPLVCDRALSGEWVHFAFTTGCSGGHFECWVNGGGGNVVRWDIPPDAFCIPVDVKYNSVDDMAEPLLMTAYPDDSDGSLKIDWALRG